VVARFGVCGVFVWVVDVNAYVELIATRGKFRDWGSGYRFGGQSYG
jgi:hypothetical protein